VPARLNLLLQNRIARYLFAASTVAVALGLRFAFIPLTGTGAPFVFFFTAVMVTSLLAGVGPGIFALLLSLPLGTYMFVGRGYSLSQGVFRSLLVGLLGLSKTPTASCAVRTRT